MVADDIAKLIEEERAVAAFIPLAKALAPFRVSPFVRMLCWPDLGKKKTGLTLAYSEFGHGERGDHWG